jgi:hypothetical protein
MPSGYLAVCAIFKWEWPWLAEWIVYHRRVGVDHFFLCCNEEVEDARRSAAVLAPFLKSGLVTCHGLLRPGGQMIHYANALRAARGQFRWLAAIDLDEFLYPVQTQTVSEVLKDYEAYPSLAVNWRCFGSGGNVNRPPSQLSGFVWRSRDEWESNRHIKSIVDPSRATLFLDPHRADVPAVDENYKPVEGSFNDFTARQLVVNHYIVRSLEDYRLKSRRGKVEGFDPQSYDQRYFEYNDRNEVFDDSIARRFGPAVEADLAAWRANPPPTGTASA